MPENKLQALHANLSKLNPEFKVPLEQFENDMQDETKLQTLHGNLAKQHEDFKVPYEQFKSDMWSNRPTTQPLPAAQAAQAAPETPAAAPGASATPVAEPTNAPQLSFQSKGFEIPGAMDKILPTEKTPMEKYVQPAVEQADVTQVQQDPKLTKVDTLKAEYLTKTRGADYANKWAEEASKTGSFADEAGARLMRAYTEFNQMLVNAPNTLLRMVNALPNELYKAVGLPEVSGDSFNKLTGLDKNVASLEQTKEALSQKILKLNPDAEASLVESLGKGDFGAFGRNIAGSVLEALPLSISLMTATPAVGSSAVTAAGAVLFGGQKMKELDEKAPNMPEGIKALVGATNGALEGWFESTFGSGAVSSAMMKLIANEGKTVAKETIKGGLREGFTALLTKYPALAPMGEFYEEFATQTAQNYVDILAGIKPMGSLFEGSLDNGLVGLASGGLHTAPLSLVKSYERNKAKQVFSDNREQATRTIQQNFDALKQPDGNLHTGFDKEGMEVIITSTTPGGMAVLHDGRIVDISDIQDVQVHSFEALFGQQMAEFDATNDPDLQVQQPQVQSTFNWNGRNMQLTDVSDKDELLAQEIDAEGEPVGRPEPISMEEYRKVVEQQVAAPEATPELRTYDIAGTQVPFTPQGDGSYLGEAMKTPEEAQTAFEELTKQIGAENAIEIKTVPGADNLTPATYQLSVRPKTPEELAAPVAEKVSPLDQLIPEGEAKQYTLNGQPIERGKALTRVKAAIFANDRKKIEGLDVTGDEELTKMLEKAFPVKITIGKKKASTEDALNWVDAADTIEELRMLTIEGAAPTNDVKNAYALKVKELTPEVSPEEITKLTEELFAEEPAAEVAEPEVVEQEITEPTNTKQDDNTNTTGLSGSEQVGETPERAGSEPAGSGRETAASGAVQSDGQGLKEEREGGPSGSAEVRAEDQGTPATAKAEGLKAKRKPSPSKLADLYKTRLSKLKQGNPKTYWSVDLPSDADLLEAAKDGRLVDMNGGMAYVTKDGDLKGLFKYDPAAKGTAKVLQAERIKMGGIKLDAYDTEGTGEVSLVPTYKKNGFREVARVDFNPEFAPPDMPESVKAMNPDVVVMAYDPENKLPIKERRFNKEQYEEALAYRDSYVTEEPIPDHNKSGDTHDFFSDVVTGTSDKFKPRRKWEPLMEFSPKEETVRPTFEKFNGNFDEHIATSIPGFRDIQIKVVSALNEMFKGKDALIYDIGGSEGGFVKTITELSDGRIKSINLDANGEMQAVHNATPVEGSTFVKEAFGPGFEWDGVEYHQHEPKQKADVVHESMTFQFIDEKRGDKLDELVEKYIKPDGIFITEEKIHPKSQEQWAANEAKKDADFKLKYYDQDQISAKRDEVLTGMVTNQTTYDRYKNELLKKFDYVEEYWDSGNFKGIVASNDKVKVDEFLANVGNTDTEFSEKNIKVGAKPRFKKKPGFYSPTEKALEVIQQNKGSVEQFKAMLLKNGAKQAEMEWMGFDEAFPDGKASVTKAEIQTWISQNMIDVKEVEKGGPSESDIDALLDDKVGEGMTRAEAREYLENDEQENPPKFSQYVEPGGENYKELLLTIPAQPLTFEEYKNESAKAGVMFGSDQRAREEYAIYLEEPGKDISKKANFKSVHYDEPNIVAHIRFNERTAEKPNPEYKDKATHAPNFDTEYELVDKGDSYKVKNKNGTEYFNSYSKATMAQNNMDEQGLKEYLMKNTELGKQHPDFKNNPKNLKEKVLFVEEFQSDWAQKGKKEGFKANPTPERKAEIKKRLSEINEAKFTLKDAAKYRELDNEAVQLNKELGEVGITNMPFAKTDQWINLAFRRMMLYATENGFDRIAWTNGEMQAARYDLSKQIDRVVYAKNENGTFRVFADKNNSKVFDEKEMPLSSIEDNFGKEIAKSISENAGSELEAGDPKNRKVLSGDNLKVGGSGMKAFYDAIIPSAANKLGKPFGAKVEEINIKNTDINTFQEHSYLTVQSLPVTEAMKTSVQEKGVPLFKKKHFSLLSMVDRAAAQTDTNPSEAQIEAGNYQKGHVSIQGMEVSIENPKGSVRRGTDEDGKAWETKMESHYGYFKGTVGRDGDHVDTFIGPNPENQTIFVVDQNNPKTGEFDESKVMLGYNTLEEAKAAYMAHYEPGWTGMRDITSVGVEPFKKWLYDGARQRKPFGEYAAMANPIRYQAKKLYAGLETVPKFKDLTELTTWLQKWGKKNKVFASEEAKLDDDKFVKGLVKHTVEELAAFEELSEYPYLGFYDYDIPTRLNPELQKFAEKRYGYELSSSQMALYHLVSGFASPSADPVMDSSKGLDVFDRYMRTEELTSASDKPATVWSMNEMGKKVDTGVPKLDAEGNPVYSQVTVAYATASLNKFRDNVLKHFKGDIDKAMDWISTRHSYEEISKMMGVPVKGKGSLDVHEYLTKEDGGFGIFGFTGAKLGSYVLNRIGNYSTVTKDMWYARTMARLTGEALQEKTGEALKLPWAITVEGRRKRALADKAWGIVADKLGTTPADVQQKMWEFERRLYEKIGSGSKSGYASEGFLKRAKELEPELYEPFTPAKPTYKKKPVSVSGANAALKAVIENWENAALVQTHITLATEVETADLLRGRIDPAFEKEIREAGFYGLYADGEIFLDPTMDDSSALITWLHEKSHIAISSSFKTEAAKRSYMEKLYEYIGVSEFRRVVPVEYWFDAKDVKAEEYLTHLAEDIILQEGKLEGAPEFAKNLIFGHVESFIPIKYLQDEKQRLDQTARGQNVSEADNGRTPEIAGNRPGEEGVGDGSLRPDEGGAEVDIWEQLFEGVPAYKLKEETINVDGVDRPVLNSKGLPIHATTEGVKNFWKWFGDSKVVDEQGRPLVLLHGTNREFKEFIPYGGDYYEDSVFFFTNNPELAQEYADTARGTGSARILEVYLALKDPKVFDYEYKPYKSSKNEELLWDSFKEGFDSLILRNVGEGFDADMFEDQYIAFDPTQVKSATGNLGGFDPTDPRISFKRKPAAVVDKKQVQTTGEKIQEILVNNKLALKNWMEDIQTIVPTIQDYENPLLKDALAKSKVTTKLHNFEGKQYKRLIASVADVLKTSKISKEELSHYLIAVHGVERNQKFWNAEPLRVGEDFSGLSELKKTVRDAADPAEQLKIDGMNNETFAEYYQKQIEAKLSPRQVKELWDSIRDISKVTLDELLDAGMISKAYYDELRQMYKNYIPLRAWEDSNPEAFEFGQGVGSYNAPILQAKGRKSLAEDPLATLLQMANTAYISGERNRVKVAAGELVRNNDKALKDFAQYKRTYFVKQGTDAQGNPIIQETIDRPDQDLFDQGLVTTKVPKEYTARKTSAQAKEFEVEFFRNGNKYILVFQGSDPAVARAINNKEASLGLDYLNKVTSAPIKFGKVEIPSISGMSRYLSAINTTYSVDFPLVNFLRDAPMAILSEYVYGDAKEAFRMFPFMKDAEAAMRRKLQGKQDLNNSIDQQLEDFFNFGGPTGFAFLKNVEEFKASVKRDVRRINAIKNPLVRMESGFAHGLKLISQLSEWSETTTRFAGYLNHIQQGDSKEKAALAAKNLTVNFDQKGRLSPTLNGLYTFFNAAIQAVDKYFKLWGRNWKKMAAIHMFLTVQGFLNAMLLDLFGGEDDEKVKNYDKVSDYTKKNNLVIPIPGTNETFSFPIPQILRKFHAIGFDAYDLMSGKKQVQEVLLGQLSSIPSDISPIDTESFLNGDGDLSIKPLVPSILKPLVELEANENFMKLPISPEPFSLDLARKIADTRRVYKDVNQIAQYVTDKMYELGGGDETGFKYVYDDGELKSIPALLDVSPESIEHLFESYFGGVGKLVNRTGKTTSDVYSFGKKLVEGGEFKEAIKEINVNVIPVANRFIRTPMGDPLQKEFRKVRNDFENKLKVLKQAEKDKDFEKFNTIYMQIGGKLEQYKAIMTTFEKLDEERLKLEKVSPEDAKEVNKIAREQMQEIIKLK